MNIKNFVQEFNLSSILFEPSKRWLVYILLDKGEVVYVGKSDVSGYDSRLRSHRKKEWIFDSVQFISTGSSEGLTLQIEKGLISASKPKYNTTHKDFCVRKVNGMFKGVKHIVKNRPQEVEVFTCSTASEQDQLYIMGVKGVDRLGDVFHLFMFFYVCILVYSLCFLSIYISLFVSFFGALIIFTINASLSWLGMLLKSYVNVFPVNGDDDKRCSRLLLDFSNACKKNKREFEFDSVTTLVQGIQTKGT